MGQYVQLISAVISAGATVYSAKQANKAFGSSAPEPATIASPPPPVTEQSSQATKAKQDAILRAKKRQGFATTIKAGETGGFGSTSKLGGGA